MAKPTFKTEKHNEETSLMIHGDVNVKHSDELKKFLLQSISRKGNEKLVLNEATEFDVTSAQLTYLWKKSLEQQSRKVTIQWPDNKSLRELLDKTGITKIL